MSNTPRPAHGTLILSHDRKRYVDGIHYCTKTSWFSNHPHNFPAPFNEAFHLTMGVEAAGSVGMDDSSGAAEGDLASSPVIVPEMLVDYARIAQVW